ncbi:OadG family protein [Oceanispirochaeta sp.]|jgi:oxaloacetate decarboxylase gamma subunit|uniref:OadG family protein n=1 Tax=Oceanispirochaeta sp. TaxID=2035350 RepID=UPI0026152B46|nr:OadG family protein [Oceanispirochaeta sp.]MDA3957307.1 OadG family protein [Oceanispirochaeta sp.]
MVNGLIVTIVGMSVVFLFLALLVISTITMSKIVLKFFPEQEKPAAPAVRRSSADAEIAVAIAAVKAHTQS